MARQAQPSFASTLPATAALGSKVTSGVRESPAHWGGPPRRRYLPSTQQIVRLPIGRQSELTRLTELLDGVESAGAGLLLRGDAGIGKSTVLEEVARAARSRDFRVLQTSGVQAESELPFAGLHQLLRPVLPELECLPAPQRQAVHAAFGMTEAAAPDRFLIALATLSLLSEIAQRMPTLVVADDVHWLDSSTAEVLAFVARRVESDRLIILAALRTGFDSPLASISLPEITLEGLDRVAAEALLAAHAPDIAPGVRERLLQEAEGNPLALVELPSALTTEHLDGVTPLPSVLPVTERIVRAFVTRLDRLPRQTRAFLLIGAIDAGGPVDEIFAAASVYVGVDIGADAPAPAVDAGLISVDQSAVRFRHPLVRSAVHEAASLAERQAAHAAVASVLTSQRDRQTWHQAAAVVGRNDTIARSLEESGTRAIERGALPAAAAAFERAAELSTARADQIRRALQASELNFELGHNDAVRRLLAAVEPSELEPAPQARVVWLSEMVDPRIQTQADRFHSLVDLAERAHEGGDDRAALNILWLAAQRTQWRDPGPDERLRIAAAAKRLAGAGSDIQIAAISAYADPLANGGGLIDAVSQSHRILDPLEAQMAGTAAVITGSFDLASELLATSAAGLRSQGRLGHLARVQMLQGWSATYIGDWTLAITAADEAKRFGHETGQPLWAGGARIVEAIVAGVRGDISQAERLAAEAERLVLPFHAAFMLAGVQIARGQVALVDGRPADAFDQLRRVFDPAERAHHGVIRAWTIGDLAEAGALSGRADEGRALIAEVQADAGDSASPWFQVALLHATAALAGAHEAADRFEEAIDAAGDRWPMLRARLLLGYGAWLRRQRRIADARGPLRGARDSFDALGATGWGSRARQELRAAGEVSRDATAASWERLSAQELHIAHMAAEGLSNHEIAGKLFLSHRTVASHLYRVFPKLGVTSRGQLSAALAQVAASPSR